MLDTQRAELAARKKLQAEALQEEHQAEQVRVIVCSIIEPCVLSQVLMRQVQAPKQSPPASLMSWHWKWIDVFQDFGRC